MLIDSLVSMSLLAVSTYLMSHKKTMLNMLPSLILLTLIFIFSSCSEYLKGKPFKESFVTIKTDGKLACLDSVSADLQSFLEADSNDAKIDDSVTCINLTLSELQKRVEGATEATSFTANEVYEILAKFASSANISQSAAKNLIGLKAAILGGDEGKITKAEINLLKDYLLLVKAEAKKLKPFIKLFYFKTTERTYTKAFIKEGFDQLNASLKSLYKSSQLGNSNYSFGKFKELIIAVLNLSEDKKAMAEIASKMNSLINGNQAVLTGAERLAYVDNLTEVLRIYSLYSNGYAKFEISTSAGINESIGFTEDIINLVENSLQYKNTQGISAQSIDGLIVATTNNNFLQYKISSYTAAMFYRTILVRVFEAGAKGNILGFTGLKNIHLKNIKSEIAIYKVYSKMLERVAGEELLASRGLYGLPLREIQQALGALNISAEVEILNKYDAETQAKIINNVFDLRSEFLEAVPIIYRNKKIAIASNQETWEQKWKDLARGLYVKMFARLLMQGWGQIYPLENTSVNYLTETDMYNWYSEIKDFSIAIKSFDPRTANSGRASLKVANLFTRSGNGDNKLNFKELTENLGILFSGGGIMHDEISNGLVNARCNLPELDIFDNHWNYETCLYQVLRTNYKFYYSSLPHLISYLDTLNEEQFMRYFEAVLNVVRIDDNNIGRRVETADIRSMNSLLHFIESLYVVHDTNANWQISAAEIKQAYPKFSSISTEYAYKNSRTQIENFKSWLGDVAGYACFTEQDLIRESFVFLVFNGRTPVQSDFNYLPCFRGVPLLYFQGEVDRKSIINTFKALKSVI